jgi:hypothetical protein
MKKSLSSFIALATLATMTAPLSAEILVGWNVFDPNTVGSRVDDNTPDTVAAGVSGLIGIQVLPDAATQGGGLESKAAMEFLDNVSYGLSYPIPEGDKGGDSGIAISTFGTNMHVDILVTNNTGADLTIDYIHFDYRLNFGQNITPDVEWAQGAVQCNHLSGASQLEDGFTGRLLFESDPIQGGPGPEQGGTGDYTWKQVDVSTAAMTDVTLADGESAAFRISTIKVNDYNNGFRLDNIAISTGPLPEPPAPQWAGYDIDENGAVDTGAWLGVLNVNYGDYVWSYTLESFLYLPESHAEMAGGSWSYVYNY